MFLVRPALMEDAPAAVAVLRASITESCVADHHHDLSLLEDWLRNKTPEQFWRWLADPDTCLLVAEWEGEVRGVGGLRRTGDLDLCYVHPRRQRVGLGRQLLAALEAQARRWGLPALRLTSTITARAFYERHGYVLTAGGAGPQPELPYAKALL